MTQRNQIEDTKRLMGALVRMKPKPHEEMKVGKSKKSGERKNRSGKKSTESTNR